MKYLKLFPLALLALSACVKETQEQPATPINFFSTVSQTKSANVNLQKVQIASGVQVGVFVKGADSYITGGDNACLTADGNGSFTGTTLYFPTDGSAVSVNAYAPYAEAFTGKADQAVPFSVSADQSTDTGYLSSDLLCGAPTGTNSFTKDSPNVSIAFAHKLSKLSVKFTLGETDVNLKGATINIVNTLPGTTLKVSDGTLGEATGEATPIKAVTFASDATTFVASAVMVPQTVAAGSFIQVVLSDKILNAQLNSDATFLSGKAYTYNVNISGEGAETKAEIELASTVTDWDEVEDELTGEVTEEELPELTWSPTSFVALTSGQNATYENGVYTWTASSNNLMTVVEFASSELAQYKTLQVTVSDFDKETSGSWRLGYVLDGGSYTNFTGSPYYSGGTKTVDLSALGIDLSKVTKIQLGGNSGSGSLAVSPSDIVLKGTSGSGSGSSDGGSGGDDSGSGSGDTLAATFGTPGGNASYSAPTYTWTDTSNNLMTCFEFSNGELAGYKKLTFTLANLTSGTMVRMGYYVGSTFTEFGSGYGSNGTKEVDLTALGIDLATVTKIAFGGRTGTGSVDIVASEVVLSKE